MLINSQKGGSRESGGGEDVDDADGAGDDDDMDEVVDDTGCLSTRLMSADEARKARALRAARRDGTKRRRTRGGVAEGMFDFGEQADAAGSADEEGGGASEGGAAHAQEAAAAEAAVAAAEWAGQASGAGVMYWPAGGEQRVANGG